MRKIILIEPEKQKEESYFLCLPSLKGKNKLWESSHLQDYIHIYKHCIILWLKSVLSLIIQWYLEGENIYHTLNQEQVARYNSRMCESTPVLQGEKRGYWEMCSSKWME